DPHVVGDEVDQEAQAVAAEDLREAAEGCLAAELTTDAIVIGDVIPVRALRAGLEERRRIAVRDPKGCQIGDERRGIVEGEWGAELQTISGQRDAGTGRRSHRVSSGPSAKPSAL